MKRLLVILICFLLVVSNCLANEQDPATSFSSSPSHQAEDNRHSDRSYAHVDDVSALEVEIPATPVFPSESSTPSQPSEPIESQSEVSVHGHPLDPTPLVHTSSESLETLPLSQSSEESPRPTPDFSDSLSSHHQTESTDIDPSQAGPPQSHFVETDHQSASNTVMIETVPSASVESFESISTSTSPVHEPQTSDVIEPADVSQSPATVDHSAMESHTVEGLSTPVLETTIAPSESLSTPEIESTTDWTTTPTEYAPSNTVDLHIDSSLEYPIDSNSQEDIAASGAATTQSHSPSVDASEVPQDSEFSQSRSSSESIAESNDHAKSEISMPAVDSHISIDTPSHHQITEELDSPDSDHYQDHHSAVSQSSDAPSPNAADSSEDHFFESYASEIDVDSESPADDGAAQYSHFEPESTDTSFESQHDDSASSQSSQELEQVSVQSSEETASMENEDSIVDTSSAVSATATDSSTPSGPTLESLIGDAESLLYRGKLRRALQSYRKAIEKFNSSEAHYAIAETLLHVGDPKDGRVSATEVLFHLQKALDAGDSHAQALMSVLYSVGILVPQDDALSILNGYFSALGDSASGKLLLAYRHLHGLGVPQVCTSSAAYYQELAAIVIEQLSADTTGTNAAQGASLLIERQRLSDDKARGSDSGLGYFANWLVHRAARVMGLDLNAALGDVGGGDLNDIGIGGQGAFRHMNPAERRPAQNNNDANQPPQNQQQQQQQQPQRRQGGGWFGFLGLGNLFGGGGARGGAGGNDQVGDAGGDDHADLGHQPVDNHPQHAGDDIDGGDDVMGDDADPDADEAAALHGFDDAQHEADVVQYYRHAAQQGDPHAQVAMGQMHFHGFRGVAHDMNRAVHYFQLAANQGDALAMTTLGQLYLQGIGVQQNNETALEYFRKAAAKGSVGALNGLGYMYMHGMSVPVDNKEALKYFKKAAEHGSADAQFNLGSMYFAGLGKTPVDMGAALKYFGLAAQQGHTRAIYNLGQMHLHGMGTPQSCAIAVRLLKTVAERGEWASILKEAHGDYMRGFDRKALMLYMQAAEEGFEVAQNNAAWLLERISNSAGHSSRARASDDSASDLLTDVLPNARARRALALRYWQRAAEQGNAEAQRKVGDYFYYGWSAALLKDDSNKTKSTEATEKTASASESTSSSELPSDPPGSTSSSQPESDGEPSSSDSENNMQSSDDQSSSQESAASFSFSFNFNFDSTSDHSKNTSNDADDKSWVVSDYESAAQAYIAAAEARNAQAMFNVGFMYEHGVGLKRDLHLAKRYYDMALAAAPEAVLPIRLALGHLWARLVWEESVGPYLIEKGYIAPSWLHWYTNFLNSTFFHGDPYFSLQTEFKVRTSPSPATSSFSSSSPSSETTPITSPSSWTDPSALLDWIQTSLSPAALSRLKRLSGGLISCWEDVLIAVLSLMLAVVVYLRSASL